MLSELFRIPLEIGSVPLFGVGLLLALWLLGFGGMLFWHARKHGLDSDFWGYLLPGALATGAILLVPRFAPEGIPIRGYGVMLLLAISTGLAMAIHRAQQRGISADTIFSLAFWLFVFGIAGARLFFVIEYWEVRFAGQEPLATLIDVLQFTEGGLVVYGSLIGAGLAFFVFTYRNKLPALGMADILAPSLVAGLAIGRLGCFLNGCCYGGLCTLPWAVTFPPNSPPFIDQLAEGQMHGLRLFEGEAKPREDRPMLIAPDKESRELEEVESINRYLVKNKLDALSVLGQAYSERKEVTVTTDSGSVITGPPATNERSLPVHPTQVYSAVNAGLIAWLLWSYYPGRRRHGEVILLLLTIYPVSRFLLEVIRTDEDPIFGTGLSISQNVSIGILVLALLAWPVLWRQPPIKATEPKAS